MRVFNANRVFAVSSIAVSLAYFASFAFVLFVVSPLQDRMLPALGGHASLLFLPTGVKIFAIIVCAEFALPALFAAELLCNHFVWGGQDPGPLLSISLISVAVFYATIAVARKFGVIVFLHDTLPRMPRAMDIFLVSLIASVLNGILCADYLSMTIEGADFDLLSLAFVLGDLSGAMTCFIVVSFAYGYLNSLRG